MKGLAEARDDVRVVKLRRNFGKAAALSHGFAAARGDYIVTMDGDRPGRPGRDPQSRRLRSMQGYDLVSGWKQRRQDPLNKTLPSRLFNWTVRKASGIPLHDFNCGLKSYKRDVVDTISIYGELHRYIPVVAAQAGFSVTEVKVSHRRRTAGRSKYGWQRYMRGYLDLLTVLFLGRFQHRPQHLFGGFGTLLIFIGVLVEIYLTIDKLVFGNPIGQRPLLLLGALFIIVGVQLLSLGLIGELIANSRARRGPDPTQVAVLLEPGRPATAPESCRRRRRGGRVAGRRRSRRTAVTRAVAYFGTYEPDYPRNAVLITGLREHGVEVFEFQAALPRMTAAEMAGGRGAARLAAGIGGGTRAAARPAPRRSRRRRGRRRLPGSLPGAVRPAPGGVPPCTARLRPAGLAAGHLRGRSRAVRSGGGKAAAVRVVDAVAFGLPHLVLADTWAHAAYYQEAFGLARDHLAVVPVGALPRAPGGRVRPDAG